MSADPPFLAIAHRYGNGLRQLHRAEDAGADLVEADVWLYRGRLEREVGDLREALETRKVVERAKGVLMETLGLREADAFHRIRKTSMDTRKSMREVAEAVLLAHEMERSAVD